jgi:hypothetical protein
LFDAPKHDTVLNPEGVISAEPLKAKTESPIITVGRAEVKTTRVNIR